MYMEIFSFICILFGSKKIVIIIIITHIVWGRWKKRIYPFNDSPIFYGLLKHFVFFCGWLVKVKNNQLDTLDNIVLPYRTYSPVNKFSLPSPFFFVLLLHFFGFLLFVVVLVSFWIKLILSFCWSIYGIINKFNFLWNNQPANQPTNQPPILTW